MQRSDAARHWGLTAAERAPPFPCDRYVDRPDDAYFRAVDVDAPPAALFRWLCQLRAAPYSYDLLDNFGRRSPRELTPGLDRLEVGQRVMTIFDLVEFERDRHLTLKVRRPSLCREIAVTYLVVARGEERSRLVVKLLLAYAGPAATHGLARRLFPPAELAMMRKQLLTLKELVER